ncbi:MAG: DNA primase [Aureliella sp.]
MISNAMPSLGYRIVGQVHNDRRLVDYESAFVAYCECDYPAKIDEGGFLSSFVYPDSIRRRDNGYRLDVRGYDGTVWSRYLWFDIDDTNPENAIGRTRRIVSLLMERYCLADDELLVFFSGSKGFHLGVPISVFGSPIASAAFAATCRQLANRLVIMANSETDPAVYQKVQPFRAPNSRHHKTGLYKRLVSVGELVQLTADAIRKRAANPLPFEQPDAPKPHELAVQDWQLATDATHKQAEAFEQFANERTVVNRSTLEFIAEDVEQGDRHRLLYSAAANLFEFGCPPLLAHGLLSEPARNVGLAPNEIRRAIGNAYRASSKTRPEETGK